MKPSIGRIVHYVSYGTPGGEYTSQCRAAVITASSSPEGGTDGITPVRASLCVLNPTGLFFNEHVAYSEGHEGGTWHWPERVEG